MRRGLSLIAFILCQSTFCWLATVTGVAQVQNLRAATASSYVERGNKWFAKSDYARAEADYGLAIASDPGYADAYYNRAMTRVQLDKLDGALTDFNRVLQLTPHDATAYTNRGSVRYKLGDFAGTISDTTKAIELNPRLAEAWGNRGQARRDKGDLAGAITDLDQSLKLNPRIAQIWGSRGMTKLLQGNLAGSISDYTREIQLAPDSAVAYCDRGAVRQQTGDLDEWRCEGFSKATQPQRVTEGDTLQSSQDRRSSWRWQKRSQPSYFARKLNCKVTPSARRTAVWCAAVTL